MAERIAGNAEHLVDEMKRKARRRLVGAIVLALAAVVILPLLLEKEPRPLGEDVSVQIPPVDESKFVNRLTGKAGDAKPLPKVESKVITTAPGKSEARAEDPGGTASVAMAPATPKTEATVAAQQEAMSETKGDATAAPKVEPRSTPSSEPSNEPKPSLATANPPAEATPQAPSASTAVPAKADGFVVQLAAFADDKGANALANKLKKNGYAAYVQPVETSRGTLWRVRVGGYASRPEADAARVTLKGEGYSGIIAPVQ